MPAGKTSERDYVVEKILAKGASGNGRPLYLVKWKGIRFGVDVHIDSS